ncbi:MULTISPECIES: hypothetical protein [unclassified Rhodococcus (in: high G+C Gram-positive bacteria)]|nr:MULTISPECIES: hypothetical protein [unclassified Rhodococcus (in: high G+C Gram-positive bacteria)]
MTLRHERVRDGGEVPSRHDQQSMKAAALVGLGVIRARSGRIDR